MSELKDNAIILFEKKALKKNKILADRVEELRLNMINCAINYSRNPTKENKEIFDKVEYSHKILLNLINEFNDIE